MLTSACWGVLCFTILSRWCRASQTTPGSNYASFTACSLKGASQRRALVLLKRLMKGLSLDCKNRSYIFLFVCLLYVTFIELILSHGFSSLLSCFSTIPLFLRSYWENPRSQLQLGFPVSPHLSDSKCWIPFANAALLIPSPLQSGNASGDECFSPSMCFINFPNYINRTNRWQPERKGETKEQRVA